VFFYDESALQANNAIRVPLVYWPCRIQGAIKRNTDVAFIVGAEENDASFVIQTYSHCCFQFHRNNQNDVVSQQSDGMRKRLREYMMNAEYYYYYYYYYACAGD
jgi:hypothetical protein